MSYRIVMGILLDKCPNHDHNLHTPLSNKFNSHANCGKYEQIHQDRKTTSSHK